MNKLAEQLREIHVHNDWELVSRFGEAGRDVYLSYTRNDARSVLANRTHVVRPGFKTDPQAHWADYGCKAFIGNKKESIPLAEAWASERYGITGWTTSPFGGRVPMEVMRSARAAVKAK